MSHQCGGPALCCTATCSRVNDRRTLARMKQAIITSVALSAISTAWSTVNAQTVPAPAFAPTQGQAVYTPSARSIATANDNNNAQAPAVSGSFANPTPGTIVIHLNGRVNVG